MGITQELYRLRQSVAQNEKLIEDFDLMQADTVPRVGTIEPSAEAMWTLTEKCAHFAEMRKISALKEINHLLWLTDRVRRER
jgi:hypothetical protein